VPDAPPPVRIVALSDDPNLLDALHGAVPGQAALIISPSADRFVDQLVANAAGIALIDASSTPPPLKAFIALIREQFPQLLLILAGAASVQAQLSEQIAAGTVFRFVHKPVSSQRLKFFIDAALRARSPEQAASDAPAPVGLEPAVAPRRGLRAIPGMGLGLALLSAALAAAAIAWSLAHHASAP
jgi:DNA-binding NtrC family response regulator